jgi:hypothetical protein
MALGVITDPSALSQGGETVISDMVFGTPTGNQVSVTGTGFPILVDNEYVEIRDHSDTVNNGLYRVDDATPSAGGVVLDKVSGSNPIAAVSESASIFSSIRNAETIAYTNASGAAVDITGTGLPSLAVGERFIVEDMVASENNGAFEVTVVNTDTSDYTCAKLTGTNPSNAGAEPATMITTVKTVMYDTAGLGVYLLEPPTAIATMDLNGVQGQAFYSFTVDSWKDDAFLIANAPFPMLTVDADAGKYVLGQDPSGNNNGWAPVDVTGEAIRTRKMFRNMGWSEVSSAGVLNKQSAGIRTLGAFLDETETTGDTAYYQFGTDTTVDDTVSFTFAGPVNEAVEVYDGLATPADTTPAFAITTNNTITRNDGGNWRTDGYVVGGQIEILDAEDPANNGTYVLTSVGSGVDGAVVVAGTPLTNNADDTTIHFAVDNRNGITLRVRVRTTSGNTNARTFSQSNLAAAGETILSNRLFTFGLSNAQDLNITESDANIDGTTPYTNMTITYYATPQSKGGSGDLVGGPYNFGIVIDASAATPGTNTEVYEWTQRQLRKTTDIDNDADTAIGVTMDGLMRFVGAQLQVGSVDGGLTFPTNPDGGGSGVFIDNLNSASRNNTVYYDNLGTQRAHPLGVAVTLDFNQTALDAAALAYTLFFDYTIRTTVADLVITAGTLADGTFNSAAGNLPSTLDAGVGAYVRVSGLTGADAPMNGIYQVTTISSAGFIWDVTRYDGDTIVTTSSASVSVDEHPVDSPDFVIVQDDVPANVTGTNPSADVVFTFDYSGNTQGGRTASTDANVVFRAIGQSGAQYGQTAVLTIGSTAVTLPLTNNIERNYSNP